MRKIASVAVAVLASILLVSSVAKAQTGTINRWGGYDTPARGDSHQVDSPTAVGDLSNITTILAGNASYMALDATGHVWTWGDGVDGVLGDGGTVDHPDSAVEVAGLPTIRAIGEADDTDVAIDTDGNVWGWGWNEGGQLCLGDTKKRLSPVELTNLSGVAAAAGGGTHMTYLLSNGTMEACGENTKGQLGNGTTVSSTTPVSVIDLPASPITAITAGPSTSTALFLNGQVWDWGNNVYGQLGDGTKKMSDIPVNVKLPGPAIEVYAGGDQRSNGQSLALITNDDETQVWGWGDGANGQLGNGSNRRVNRYPVEASALPSGVTFTYVATGGAASYALTSTGDLYSFGSNSVGQIGDKASGGNVMTPTDVMSGVTNVTSTANDVAAD
jgi:alpha-tubulin suppressor-like RCC1 family protein